MESRNLITTFNLTQQLTATYERKKANNSSINSKVKSSSSWRFGLGIHHRLILNFHSFKDNQGYIFGFFFVRPSKPTRKNNLWMRTDSISVLVLFRLLPHHYRLHHLRTEIGGETRLQRWRIRISRLHKQPTRRLAEVQVHRGFSKRRLLQLRRGRRRLPEVGCVAVGDPLRSRGVGRRHGHGQTPKEGQNVDQRRGRWFVSG